jgi:hypothetical protein
MSVMSKNDNILKRALDQCAREKMKEFDRELAKVELDSITFSDNFKRRMNTLFRNLGYNNVPHPEVETEEMKE